MLITRDKVVDMRDRWKERKRTEPVSWRVSMYEGTATRRENMKMDRAIKMDS